ncbi:helix-turn-helix transcriptional regulator [Chryseobacterium sp. Ch-15]|uniref:Helix-turn-helix transcriptional regulator n=1 Tax=Chryseobacterium muglaense TaxID=2893752 RepID=A0A9Q3YUU9_9FLAO|nr:helix-turn-helix transcriptional regulator [Chryseobacterium muglaense]MBD3903328.1 helix-turn-helix transcriptional regulator [Chryseobacterium muglaense]MCC9036157.1 helix-turn-helix transcriptional regulator [Chryseobacterium muglaense]MCM2553268.1 helix-turn-helix transcriptional regulator [Chryseobacterium muglaense]
MNPIYNEYYVNGKGARFIKKLWILNNSEDHLPILNKGVPPNGCFTMSIIEGNGLNVKHKGQIRHLSEGIYFCGQITETLSIDILSKTKATMIQLFPWTPSYFGISDAYLFTNNICLANEITNFKALNLDAMIGLENERLCRYLVKTFTFLFRSNANIDLITQSVQFIMKNRGNITVASVARSLKCSERHLQKLFKSFIGISPKLFINIIKLREALDGIVYPIDKPETMTQLAVSNGYYDQPHFNNTFSSFIGKTPKNFNEKEFFLTIKK